MSARRRADRLQTMWTRHAGEWRDGGQITSQWREAERVDPALLESRASRGWWDLLGRLGVTLLVTREYEHLVLGLTARSAGPRISYLPLPHPSGLAVDRTRQRVFLASTRNPNQVYTLQVASGSLSRGDIERSPPPGPVLTPVASTFYPGCLYLHDLALVAKELHASAVGHNAIVRLPPEGGFEHRWWPKCIEAPAGPIFSQNHIQLNSIAAGRRLQDSFFTASSCAVDRRRPGHLNYPVDRRGVLFSGRSREPVCTGLTRPHSARLHDGTVWLANSGYGELGQARGGRLEVVQRLPGWTRGLCLVGSVAFVGTSRVIPRFARYAPGLDCARSRCAVHAVDLATGRTLASLDWPNGNQVFAVDWIDAGTASGFVFDARARHKRRETAFFYAYRTG
jgi:uncharacterized protein (TIGR03032 family)